MRAQLDHAAVHRRLGCDILPRPHLHPSDIEVELLAVVLLEPRSGLTALTFAALVLALAHLFGESVQHLGEVECETAATAASSDAQPGAALEDGAFAPPGVFPPPVAFARPGAAFGDGAFAPPGMFPPPEAFAWVVRKW